MTWAESLISVVQVAAGGTIVQALIALTRRRRELRQLDRQTDSVAVETAGHLVGLLRAELDKEKAEKAEMRAQMEDQQRQIASLAEQVSALRAELAVAKAEIARLSSH